MAERIRLNRKPSESVRCRGNLSAAVRETVASDGQPLNAATRAFMEPRFGHDFSKVRIHADQTAAEQTRDLDAQAYTVGSDIFFSDHAYDPDSLDGHKLIAHELTHVVQQTRHGPAGDSQGVSHPSDTAEREARSVTSQIFMGGPVGMPVQVQATPSAIASRGLVDWLEEKASDAAGAVSDVAADAWDGTKSVASDVYGGMKTAGGWVKKGEEAVNHGIDWLEDNEKAGTHWLASKAKGIPVLEQAADFGAAVVDTSTELTGGVLRGATGLVGGVAGMVANPVDTAKGLEAMAEHIPMMPGVPNPLKVAHGLLNVATGDGTWGQVGNNLNPLESLKDDGQFWKNVGGGLIGQYSEQWKQGKYADVVGHAGFDIGTLVLGAGEAGAASKLGEASKIADAARLGEVADVAKAAEVADLAKVGEVADLAKTGEVADAAKASEAVDIAKAGEVTDATKVAEAIPETLSSEVKTVAKTADETSFADIIDVDAFSKDPNIADRLSRAREFDIGGYKSLTSEGEYGRKFDMLDSDEALQNALVRDRKGIGRHDALLADNPATALSPGLHKQIKNLKIPDLRGLTAEEALLQHIDQMRAFTPNHVLTILERESMQYIKKLGL